MSKIQVNEIVNHFDNGAPDCPKGFTVSSGISTFTGAIDANGSLDVDGHTNLDNVNISGVVTSTSFVGPVTGNVIGNLTGNVTGNTSGTAGGLSGSPSISVASLVATGNVTIGGTLTYDDVTNIDSVGIITAKAGIDVTGGHIDLVDNSKIRLGTGDDLQIYHDSNNSWISDEGTGSLKIRSVAGQVQILGTGSNDNMAVFTVDGASELYYDNSKKFETTSSGVNITGNVGIASIVPKTDLDISQKTGAVALPQGTTAQRPSGSAPYIRKNTTNNALEYFDGTSWVEIITDYFPTGSTTLG
tara:strand:- start:225 stop:1127 length:903 start_codon:yes stop_codon:yes gene_type:complete